MMPPTRKGELYDPDAVHLEVDEMDLIHPESESDWYIREGDVDPVQQVQELLETRNDEEVDEDFLDDDDYDFIEKHGNLL